MAGEPSVKLTMDDGVGIITLNRPERHNAANDEMDERLWDAFRELHAAADLRCLVIRGEGKSLSSGRDTSELGMRDGDVSHFAFIERGHENTKLLTSLPCPIVVAMKGWIIGGWFERALLCDIRVAATDAKMSLPEVIHGVVPDTGGTCRLFQMAGHGMAFDLALTGRVLSAEEALTHGIVSRLVPVEQLDEVVLGIARDIATRPPLAVKLVKRMLNGLALPQVEKAMGEELLAQVVVYGSDDYAEQRKARAEDRPPVFRGR
ncbi:MAG: enoyl-CoA hydratase/isomerase family protein [Acidimicrobiales bacterium]|nr:enoyl-CoA hydratase/isomerase family protein [Acidimicrobiales bacterium]